MEETKEMAFLPSSPAFLTYLLETAEYQDVALSFFNTLLENQLAAPLVRLAKRPSCDRVQSIWSRRRLLEFDGYCADNRVVLLGIRPAPPVGVVGETIERDAFGLYLFQNCESIEPQTYRPAYFMQVVNQTEKNNVLPLKHYVMRAGDDQSSLNGNCSITLFNINENINCENVSDSLKEWHHLLSSTSANCCLRHKYSDEKVQRCQLIYYAFLNDKKLQHEYMNYECSRNSSVCAEQAPCDFQMIQRMSYDYLLGGSGARKIFCELLRNMENGYFTVAETADIACLPIEVILKIGR